MKARRKPSKTSDWHVVHAHDSKSNRISAATKLIRKGCTSIRFSVRYDIAADRMELTTIGFLEAK